VCCSGTTQTGHHHSAAEVTASAVGRRRHLGRAAEGEFGKAIEYSEKALEVFSSVAGAAAELKAAIESHEKVFREGKPWRE
jgi:hypothetical protein